MKNISNICIDNLQKKKKSITIMNITLDINN